LLALALPAGAAPDEETVVAGYRYRTLDVPFPGAGFTVVTGLTPEGLPVGAYVDANQNIHGFLRLRPGLFLPLLNTVPQDINATGTVTGFFTAPGTGIEGFTYHDGTFKRLQVPRAGPGRPFPLLTEAIAINNAGVVVGDFRSAEDFEFHGFVYDPTTNTFLTIDAPGATSTALVGLDNQGNLIGRATVGGDTHVFRVDLLTRSFVTLSIPDLATVDLVGLTDQGLLAGNVGLSGFIYDGTTVQVIDFPGSQLTELFGIREDGAVFGRYIDDAGVHHGFIATPRKRGEALVAHRSAKMHAQFTQADCCPGSKRALCRGR
jgi:hypothetical protein